MELIFLEKKWPDFCLFWENNSYQIWTLQATLTVGIKK